MQHDKIKERLITTTILLTMDSIANRLDSVADRFDVLVDKKAMTISADRRPEVKKKEKGASNGL